MLTQEKGEGCTNVLNVEENHGYKDTDQLQKVCTEIIYSDERLQLIIAKAWNFNFWSWKQYGSDSQGCKK